MKSAVIVLTLCLALTLVSSAPTEDISSPATPAESASPLTSNESVSPLSSTETVSPPSTETASPQSTERASPSLSTESNSPSSSTESTSPPTSTEGAASSSTESASPSSSTEATSSTTPTENGTSSTTPSETGSSAAPTITTAASDEIDVHQILTNSTFSCYGRQIGYYADIDSGCKLYHFCMVIDHNGHKLHQRVPYLCFNDNVFDQQALDCVESSKMSAPCSESDKFYEGSNVILRKALVDGTIMDKDEAKVRDNDSNQLVKRKN